MFSGGASICSKPDCNLSNSIFPTIFLFLSFSNAVAPEDHVQIVALPLQPVLIEVAAGFHCDQFHLQKRTDAFHRSVLGDSDYGRDGVVIGVADVRLPTLNQQQAGIDQKRRGRKTQQEGLIGQCEEI